MVSRFGAFCTEVESFDEKLFRITNVEASTMDPQQRILLEETYAAMHVASMNVNGRISSSTGDC
jgi:acyl transferase domain-containing protein